VSCSFCRIARGEVDVHVVYEDERFLAFLDHRPLFPGHALLIPREHVDSAADLGPRQAGMLGELFVVAAHLAKAERIDRSGWRLVTNVGPGAGQSVFHLHFHLLGGRGMGWPPG